jgi:hypothetical protein
VLADLGLSVVREIPARLWTGVLNGSYTVHGGVVRDAGGRIMAHLVSSGSSDLLKAAVPGVDVLNAILTNGQLVSIARDVDEIRSMVSNVLAVSAAGTALAGIGLVANVAGTIYLSRKLDSVQAGLARVERLLKDQNLAVLRAAVDNLRHAEHASDVETRKAMLVAANTDFLRSAHFYGDQFADCLRLDEVLPLEGAFTLASMGSAMCLSELGMYGAAAGEFDKNFARWGPLARKHTGKFLLGEAPHRLLDATFVDILPAQELAATMDFVHDTHRSWTWIDELRRGGSWLDRAGEKGVRAALPVAQALRAKHDALSTFAEHLRFLDARRIGVSTFAAQADARRRELGVETAWVLSAPRVAA